MSLILHPSSPLLQAKLCITDEEFKQWRFWFWSQRSNYELLGDDSVDVGAKVPMEESNSFTSVPYLGLEVRLCHVVQPFFFCLACCVQILLFVMRVELNHVSRLLLTSLLVSAPPAAQHRDDKPSKRQPSNYQSQQQIKIK